MNPYLLTFIITFTFVTGSLGTLTLIAVLIYYADKVEAWLCQTHERLTQQQQNRTLPTNYVPPFQNKQPVLESQQNLIY